MGKKQQHWRRAPSHGQQQSLRALCDLRRVCSSYDHRLQSACVNKSGSGLYPRHHQAASHITCPNTPADEAANLFSRVCFEGQINNVLRYPTSPPPHQCLGEGEGWWGAELASTELTLLTALVPEDIAHLTGTSAVLLPACYIISMVFSGFSSKLLTLFHFTYSLFLINVMFTYQIQPVFISFNVLQVPAGGGLHRHHLGCEVPAGPSAAGSGRGWRREDGRTDQYRAFGQWDGHINNGHGHQRVS